MRVQCVSLLTRSELAHDAVLSSGARELPATQLLPTSELLGPVPHGESNKKERGARVS